MGNEKNVEILTKTNKTKQEKEIHTKLYSQNELQQVLLYLVYYES